MQGRNYDVLLLRPQEITDVIDIAKAIDPVERGYREAQGFPIINAPHDTCTLARMCEYLVFLAAWMGSG